jgi:hypothetical protein
VLVSNLGGSTGALLSLDQGTLAAKLHLDVLYPVNGFKRCLDAQNGFGESCRLILLPVHIPYWRLNFWVIN